MKVKNISLGTLKLSNYPHGLKTREPGEVFDLDAETAKRLIDSDIPVIEKFDPKKEKASQGSIDALPSNLVATIYPVKDDTEHFDVVIVEGENDEDPQTLDGLTQSGVDQLLKKKKLDPKNKTQVIHADAPLGSEEDSNEWGEDLKATIYPEKDDPKHFTVVLSDSKSAPEVHPNQTQKEVDALLEEMELNAEEPKEVEKVETPYIPFKAEGSKSGSKAKE